MKKLAIAILLLTLLAASASWAGQGSGYNVAGSPAADDWLFGVDVSDTSMAPTGTNKRFPLSLLPISTAVQAALDAKQNVITICTVATIPATPATDDLIIVVDGVAPCDTTTGLGSYHSLMRWSGAAWVCLSSGVSTLDQIQDAGANATIGVGDYTIAYQIGDDGELRIGDIAGGAYLEFTKSLVRFVGAYYMEASPTLDGVDADGDWSGENLLKSFDAAETNDNFGQAVYIQSDGEIAAADCDSSSTMPAAGFAVTDAGSNQRLLRTGKIYKSAWNWNPGQPVYVSADPTTADGLTQTKPSTPGQFGQIIGIADSADSILIEIHQLVEVGVTP